MIYELDKHWLEQVYQAKCVEQAKKGNVEPLNDYVMYDNMAALDILKDK